MYIKFYKDLRRHSEVNKRDTQTQRQHVDSMNPLLSSKIKERGLKVSDRTGIISCKAVTLLQYYNTMQ
jgi:hypothetical protein